MWGTYEAVPPWGCVLGNRQDLLFLLLIKEDLCFRIGSSWHVGRWSVLCFRCSVYDLLNQEWCCIYKKVNNKYIKAWRECRDGVLAYKRDHHWQFSLQKRVIGWQIWKRGVIRCETAQNPGSVNTYVFVVVFVLFFWLFFVFNFWCDLQFFFFKILWFRRKILIEKANTGGHWV